MKNEMIEKHLGKGSKLPPFTGKLRIYNMRFCPYAQRPILVLNAKKVPYEIVNVDLSEKPEWLVSKSPLGKVPSLEIEENKTIHESLIVSDYLDDKYTTPRLTSDDPYQKALDKLAIEDFNTAISMFYKIIRGGQGEPSEELVKEFFNSVEKLQSELIKRNTKFLFNDTYPGMIDYMIWPFVERFEVLLIFSDKFALDKKRFSLLFKWIEAMKLDPAVKSYLLSTEIHVRYMKGRLTGKPDYDMLLNEIPAHL